MMYFQETNPFPSQVMPGQPGGAREPQVAIGRDGRIFVVFGADDTLYVASSADRGKTFVEPVKVGEAGILSLGMRRGPRIAVLSGTGAVVVTAVYGRQGRGRDGELMAWRSLDAGRTWSGPTTVNDVPGATREGLHAMAASRRGNDVACAWLDLRSKGTQVWASVSRDGGRRWEPNVCVYRSPERTVCECCHPSLAYDASGRLYVLFRNVVAGARDMYLVRSDDGGRTFGAAQKLGNGTWPLNACPMDGGGLALTGDGEASVATFWRRANDVYTCAPGRPEDRIARGQQPWLAAGRSGLYRIWLQGRPGRVWATLPGSRDPLLLGENGDDPVIAAAPDGSVVAAWTEVRGEQKRIRVMSMVSAR